MRLNGVWWMRTPGWLVALLIVATGIGHLAIAQTKPSATQPKTPAVAPKAAPKRAPVRRVTRPRVQTAPTRDRIVEVQRALAREGFYTGTPSGKWDTATSQAMRNFQISQGLTPTGKLGAQSLQKLGLGSEIAGAAAPSPQANARPSVLSESELNEPEQSEAN